MGRHSWTMELILTLLIMTKGHSSTYWKGSLCMRLPTQSATPASPVLPLGWSENTDLTPPCCPPPYRSLWWGTSSSSSQPCTALVRYWTLYVRFLQKCYKWCSYRAVGNCRKWEKKLKSVETFVILVRNCDKCNSSSDVALLCGILSVFCQSSLHHIDHIST